MALPQLNALTLTEYMDWEAEQPERNMYYRGEAFAMVGARQAHVLVSLNIGAALKTALRGGPCRTFVSDMKLRIDAADAVFYPDVMVSCDPRDRATPLWLSYPVLVVEVLSDSTAAFDRGAKFSACRGIDSLMEYALVDIDTRRVEVYRRNAEGLWVLHDYAQGAAVEFASVAVVMTAEAVFEEV